jgi:hypothetical protein
MYIFGNEKSFLGTRVEKSHVDIRQKSTVIFIELQLLKPELFYRRLLHG